MKFKIEVSKELLYDVIVEAPSLEAAETYAKYLSATFDDWIFIGDYEVETYIASYNGAKAAETTLDAEGEQVYG